MIKLFKVAKRGADKLIDSIAQYNVRWGTCAGNGDDERLVKIQLMENYLTMSKEEALQLAEKITAAANGWGLE